MTPRNGNQGGYAVPATPMTIRTTQRSSRRNTTCRNIASFRGRARRMRCLVLGCAVQTCRVVRGGFGPPPSATRPWASVLVTLLAWLLVMFTVIAS